jgi:Protein of unknown function (DUF1592)/Protein of unknown function (DUF1588)/Protein of unknown function (DUF1585)/Protein of unknown function (DUF1587)/Protein of unknown function (DUF1595)
MAPRLHGNNDVKAESVRKPLSRPMGEDHLAVNRQQPKWVSRMAKLSPLASAFSFIALTTLLFGVGALPLRGQVTGGTLSGTVRDASGASTLLNRYCVICHNEKLKTAGLMLDKMDVEHVSAGAEVWEKVVRKLRTGAMPPAGMPRPDKAAYDSFAAYLETALDSAAEAKPNPGRPVAHRLNRAEYSYAIRDLLALDIDAASLFSADDSGYGFDNIGDVLSVSPTLLEMYMSAAGKISRLAIGDPTTPPVVVTYAVPRLLMQQDRVSEDLPFGSRGGIAVRHYFPLDGEYVIRIRLQRNSQNYIIGLGEAHVLEVRLDGARVKLFTVGGEHKGKSSGDYTEAATVRLGDPEQENYEHVADSGLEVRIPVKAGARLVGVAFLKEALKREGELQPRPEGFGFVPEYIKYRGGAPGVGSVTIGGPSDAKGPGETPSRHRIFVCRPTGSRAGSKGEERCARQILSTLAHRAYRRPVTEGDVQALLSLYKAGSSKGGFEAGIGMGLRGLLVSPEFLFRIERDPANVTPDSAYRISDLELASRLSFFLWSSIPDDQLLDLAERGKLKEPAVLEQQVRRMLGELRSKALVSNFAGQWLYLRNMRSVSPDPEVALDFDENLREGFQQETELFLESMLREDRSVLDLLNANYTFLNERLARFYGIPNIYGSHFRRVTLSDEERRGLLGQGSILTVTSYDNRTSPVLRGKWLLENILGTAPPPPPPNVPALKDRGEDGKLLSVRQRMEQHRANSVCASCHKPMDPLGFALENFDAIGKWRTMNEDNTPIDATGVLPNGTTFQGPAGLRKMLLNHPEQFVHTVTEKLLTYALGRGVEYYDEAAVRKIVREAAPSDYHWSSIVLGIVKSAPFQMRMSASAERTAPAGAR